jgi:KDO2-lipid IV(A) lauroyltransferase
MFSTTLKSVAHHARYFPLWSALTLVRWRSFDSRSRGLGTTFAAVMRWFPPARRRFDREAKRVFPDMKRSDRAKLGQAMGRHMGRTLFEIYHDAEFQTQHQKFEVSGPGLAALKEAQAAGKGAIVVSGHFGQWEAVRAAIKMHGLESGAVYRPHKNRHYERRIRAGIEAGGMPILATGRVGTRALVRHLRDGGIISILLDEKYAEGVPLPFLGIDALTSLSAAQLALRYDLPMIPAYGIRVKDGNAFDVVFEAPIPHTDSITMTRAFNDSLSARIMANPDQWYWMLRRWDGQGTAASPR